MRLVGYGLVSTCISALQEVHFANLMSQNGWAVFKIDLSPVTDVDRRFAHISSDEQPYYYGYCNQDVHVINIDQIPELVLRACAISDSGFMDQCTFDGEPALAHGYQSFVDAIYKDPELPEISEEDNNQIAEGVIADNGGGYEVIASKLSLAIGAPVAFYLDCIDRIMYFAFVPPEPIRDDYRYIDMITKTANNIDLTIQA